MNPKRPTPSQSDRERDTARPPSSQAEHLRRFGDALDRNDRELLLQAFALLYDSMRAKTEATQAEADAANKEVGQLRKELDEANRAVTWYREQADREDQARDKRLDRIDKWIEKKDPFLDKLAEATAPKVATINKEGTEATAMATAGEAINRARYGEYAWKALVGIVMIVLAIVQAVSADRAKPTATVPIATVPTANPANPAGMP